VRLALAVVCLGCAITALHPSLHTSSSSPSHPRHPNLARWPIRISNLIVVCLTSPSPAMSSFPSCTCHPNIASCHSHLPNLTVTLPAQCHHPCLSGLTVTLVPPYSCLHCLPQLCCHIHCPHTSPTSSSSPPRLHHPDLSRCYPFSEVYPS
jgi:hypothetical protein